MDEIYRFVNVRSAQLADPAGAVFLADKDSVFQRELISAIAKNTRHETGGPR